jgi:hypothetical protein
VGLDTGHKSTWRENIFGIEGVFYAAHKGGVVSAGSPNIDKMLQRRGAEKNGRGPVARGGILKYA